MDPVNNIGITDSSASDAVTPPQLKPQSQDSPASTMPAVDESQDTSAASSAAGKRAESELEAAYFRSKLGRPTSDPGTGASAPPRSAAGVSTFLGMRLGTNQFGEEVRVKHEVGSTQGYDSQGEATAVARLSGTDPSAVLQGLDGKWHAVETTANFYPGGPGSQEAADTPTRQVYGLPGLASIDDARQKVLSLKADLAETHTPAERDQIIQDLTHARIELASVTFGVPESDINFDYTKPAPGKINLVPGDKINGADGETDTDVKTGTTVTKINVDVLEHPERAEVVQFHEATHAQDDELAHQWFTKYQQEPHGGRSFDDWMTTQAKQGRISQGDAQMVVEIANGGKSATEARAHVRAALVALQAGHPDAAKRELVGYAGMTITAHHNSGDYTNPNGASLDAVTRELQDAYRHMPKDMQQQLKAIIAAAHDSRGGNPEAWISQVKLSDQRH